MEMITDSESGSEFIGLVSACNTFPVIHCRLTKTHDNDCTRSGFNMLQTVQELRASALA